MNYQAPQIEWIEATDKDQHENRLLCLREKIARLESKSRGYL